MSLSPEALTGLGTATAAFLVYLAGKLRRARQLGEVQFDKEWLRRMESKVLELNSLTADVRKLVYRVSQLEAWRDDLEHRWAEHVAETSRGYQRLTSVEEQVRYVREGQDAIRALVDTRTADIKVSIEERNEMIQELMQRIIQMLTIQMDGVRKDVDRLETFVRLRAGEHHG